MSTNTLWDTMSEKTNMTVTANGDPTYKSALNPLLDFMFKGGAMRTAKEAEISAVFLNAYNENPIYAIRLAFYIRDIRGGQGERRFFRTCMKSLAVINPAQLTAVLSFIPEYGRWDDLLDLYKNISNTNIKQTIIKIIDKQLKEDILNSSKKKSISLLAKWMPSENTSSKDTVKLAKKVRNALGYASKQYRVMLSQLRKYLDVTETHMTAKDWTGINYNAVPSKAMMKYREAFNRNDETRYQAYIDALADPENKDVKVNAATLYPFDIVSKLCITTYSDIIPNETHRKLYDAQWKALPDFFEGKFDNALVVADVSGSMEGTPMNVCLGLAIYLAERNKGMFHNKFITFSSNPELQTIVGKDIYEKCTNLTRANWSMNTDIDAVFKLIYDAATKNHLPAEELPSAIYLISDMQFDSCVESGEDTTAFARWKGLFAQAGYKLPTIVFWNASEQVYGNIPITIKDTGAIVCSGYSPAIVKYIMESDVTDTMRLVKNIVESKRYACILAENN